MTVIQPQSLLGRQWHMNPAPDRTVAALTQQLNVEQTIAVLLAQRGLDVTNAAGFLNPRLRDVMPNPDVLLDMPVALARFVQAVQNGEKIAVLGDYDVDGATSAALLIRYGRALGVAITLYVPDRIREGYGPNTGAFDALKAAGVSLVITVDCGVTAHAPLQHANDIGLDVIVLDHHAAEPQLPPAVAVVNANRMDQDSATQQALGHCAACGVVFLFLVAVQRELKPDFDLMQLLDLVALGTVADVVPLTGLNRVFVTQGLKVMGKRQNLGLAALADVGRMTQAPDAFALGFVIGPRVNAGGRVGQSDLGSRILSTDDETQARELAQLLDGYNTARKDIEAEVLEAAIAQTENSTGNIVLAVGNGWHPGVIGVVAARLKERFYRPTFVIAVDDKGLGKGSGRSIKGVDLGALTIAARQAGLLLNGGGHSMAAGLTVANENIDNLRAFFEERLTAVMTPELVQPKLNIDSVISFAALNENFYNDLQQLAPFGSGNPEPRFMLPNCRVVFADVVGKDHVRCTLSNDAGQRVKAVAFRTADNALGQALLHGKDLLNVTGRLTLNSWNGKNTVELQIDDAAVV